jgi:gas vesicle protein
MNNSKLIAGILAGAAIGGVLGLLFAPDKGSETRRKIAEKGSDVSDAVRDKFGNMVEGVKDSFASVRKNMEDVEDKGLSRFRKVKADAENGLI